ncbi:hypothetical protein GA0070609_5602 [Micromonospora echinaurantiaca]|uniref:Uncharacterized protein n=1 Tax=Micromonospora echinaurantiaca TaxID=47857 RepID=A0A1C5K7Q5_9ACTN|nr:hypothetical protein [Micromonospora echinaurantiaca]SCG78476.1 hypothetical protein GA0070609_5602 [Micromonospora echinaurantiaca]
MAEAVCGPTPEVARRNKSTVDRLTFGVAIRVPAEAYRTGEGPLTLLITEVLGRGPFQGAEWAEVRGHEVHPDGTLRIRQSCALVRVDQARPVEVWSW